MTEPDAFAARMIELDRLVQLCRGQPPFTDGIVRDTSNRSGRDWPWWSVQIERTEDHGPDRSRVTATIRLNATAAGEPGTFEGEWQARIWQGVGADSFRARGGRPVAWDRLPTAQDMQAAMTALLDAASAKIRGELSGRSA